MVNCVGDPGAEVWSRGRGAHGTPVLQRDGRHQANSSLCSSNVFFFILDSEKNIEQKILIFSEELFPLSQSQVPS
jgi:hypothetical protein